MMINIFIINSALSLDPTTINVLAPYFSLTIIDAEILEAFQIEFNMKWMREIMILKIISSMEITPRDSLLLIEMIADQCYSIKYIIKINYK